MVTVFILVFKSHEMCGVIALVFMLIFTAANNEIIFVKYLKDFIFQFNPTCFIIQLSVPNRKTVLQLPLKVPRT